LRQPKPAALAAPRPLSEKKKLIDFPIFFMKGFFLIFALPEVGKLKRGKKGVEG
jgi:hypothetical protein